MFLHELPEAKDLFQVVSDEMSINPAIIEKDYWVMHALWGLQQQGYVFELKGGTSLSKGYGLIHRFSEDIDILVHPDPALKLKIGKNNNKPSHRNARKDFFDSISETLNIKGITFYRDYEFDDTKMRSAGIRGGYNSNFQSIASLKDGILFELGFDKTSPNEEKIISSWAYDKAVSSNVNITDNRALKVKCYKPEYTLVEKLQTISTKYRVNKNNNIKSPINFIRHYYDLYMLLSDEKVQSFIDTTDYKEFKLNKFGNFDELNIQLNPAFNLSQDELEIFGNMYQAKSDIYFDTPPTFKEIIKKIKKLSFIL